MTLRNRTLELFYFGTSHGESLIVMRIPKEKVLFIVDIVTPRSVAFRGMPDFWPDEWVGNSKFRAFYKVCKIYNFACLSNKEKNVNLAKCLGEKQVLFNPLLFLHKVFACILEKDQSNKKTDTSIHKTAIGKYKLKPVFNTTIIEE